MNSTTATKAQRTPGPWRVVAGPVSDILGIKAADAHRSIAAIISCNPMETGPRSSYNSDEAAANAAFIVTACNAYDANVARIAELEAALREIERVGTPDNFRAMIRKVIS